MSDGCKNVPSGNIGLQHDLRYEPQSFRLSQPTLYNYYVARHVQPIFFDAAMLAPRLAVPERDVVQVRPSDFRSESLVGSSYEVNDDQVLFLTAKLTSS